MCVVGLRISTILLSVGEIMTPNTENKSKLVNFNVLGLLPLAKKIFTKPTKSFRIGKFSEKPQASISFRIYSDSTLSAVVWEKTVSLQEATQWQTAKDSLEIPENGYLVSVLKNENNKETLLDEFELRTYGTQKARIIQENHYEPFGMTLQGLDYVAEDTRKNSYLYQGKEKESDLGLEMYDFHARNYDPQVCRTNQLDPHADTYQGLSPYSWCANNPISVTDPTGKDLVFQTYKDAKKDDPELTRKEYRQMKRQAKDALNTLTKNSATAKAMVTDLQNSENTHTIKATKKVESSSVTDDNGNTTITLNLNKQAQNVDSKDMKLHNMIVLGHEIGHSWREVQGLDPKEHNYNMKLTHEKNMQLVEDKY